MKLRHRVEAWLMRGLIALIGRLKLDTASNLGGWLGRNLGPRLPLTKRAEANLRLAFPESTNAWRKEILRGMWDNLGRTAFELPHLAEITDPDGDRIDFQNRDLLWDFGESTRPRLVLSGHLANWEAMPVFAGRHGIRLVGVERRPNNPLTAVLLERLRAIGGGRRIPKGSKGAREILAEMKSGGAIAMLIDQKMNDGIEVPFFGRPAMTAQAPAELALRFDAEVVVVFCHRLGPGRLQMVAERYQPPSRDVRAITADLNRRLEAWIRKHPQDWLWLHRRWPAEATSAAPERLDRPADRTS